MADTVNFEDYKEFVASLASQATIPNNASQMLHALLGMQDEVGEIASSVKQSLYYGNQGEPLRWDHENLQEELGDLMWFVGLACNVLDLSLSEILQSNVDKLEKRYPKGHFTSKDALIRRDKQHEENQES